MVFIWGVSICMTIFVVNFRDTVPSDGLIINTTSRSNNWTRRLSPFFVGPVELYDGHVALNVENCWQFSKVYEEHLNEDGEPGEKYWTWAKAGWADKYAHRYPMGKGAIPLYSLWEDLHMHYVDARKRIYIPCYSRAVVKTEAYQKLSELTKQGKDIYLQDFDAYNHKKLEMTYDQVVNCQTKKMGHAFVLAMLLDGYIEEGQVLP